MHFKTEKLVRLDAQFAVELKHCIPINVRFYIFQDTGFTIPVGIYSNRQMNILSMKIEQRGNGEDTRKDVEISQ